MGIFGMHKKIEKKKNKDLMERGEHFMAEYRELSQNYKVDLVAEIEYTPNGIIPRLRMRELVDQPKGIKEGKPWSEAKRENLELRKNCKHELESTSSQQCVICKVAKPYWNESGTGVIPEYVEKVEASIAKIKAEEEADNKEVEEATKSE